MFNHLLQGVLITNNIISVWGFVLNKLNYLWIFQHNKKYFAFVNTIIKHGDFGEIVI